MNIRIFHKFSIKSWLVLFISSIIMSIGINMFISPHNLAFGGITGLTIIIESLTGVPIYLSNAILSIFVIILGWVNLGSLFMLKTFFPTMMLPFFLFITKPLENFIISLPISAFLGAIIMGVGIGLIMATGGSTAGPDTIGLILNKYFHIPITATMITIDSTVILLGYHIYGLKIAIYSIAVSIIMNITVRLVVNLSKYKTG